MATPSSRSKSHTEHKTSSTSKSRLKKKTKKAPPTTSTTKTQKVTKAVEVPVTSGAGPEEGEFEVESICAHQWSNEHQEYEYLLKWKGYGEEDNSWVPASLMNCWDLLQSYLSTNIFNSPSASSLLSPVSTLNSATSQGEEKSHTKNKSAKSKQLNGANSSSKKSARLHSNRRVSSSAHPEKERNKATIGTQFSTPKSPLTVNLGGNARKKAPSSTKSGATKVQRVFKPKSVNDSKDDCYRVVIPSPSGSPLLSNCDSLSFSSSQSDCSVSVDETFRLYFDSDDESIVSGEGPLARVQGSSPKVHTCPLQEQKQVNGYKNSHLKHLDNTKSTPKCLLNGQSRRGKVLVKTKKKKDIMTQIRPSSTTHTSADNSSDSDSWSKRRLRKRPCSSSPAPSLESTKLGSSGHAEVSSTTSPLLQTITSPPFTSPPVSLPPTTVAVIKSSPLLPRRQSPSPEYQQELLEWQFMLNKQCRPAEAFILVENRIDEASIPWGFKYITSNVYGDGVPDPTKLSMTGPTCGCTCYIMGKRCGPKNEHCCPQMAGAEFPYSPAGKVRIPPGNPIYECNSRCSCPHDCTNRIVQHGRRINMCIFRTSNGRGWGVKTMEPIKPNTFVTEYVGEVVTTDEAERRGQLYDQEGRTYLFDLDFSCDDNAFTIDAAHYGNISHFFNHSCNPNLRVYSVWIDTLDDRLPRIAFFSTQNISAGQELTFDYQMNQEEEGQVHCLCGQSNCCGYLY